VIEFLDGAGGIHRRRRWLRPGESKMVVSTGDDRGHGRQWNRTGCGGIVRAAAESYEIATATGDGGIVRDLTYASARQHTS
jgi:hypothetical protein